MKQTLHPLLVNLAVASLALAALLLCTAQHGCAALSMFAAMPLVTFNGWTNCYRLTNDTVELIAAPAIGGRIMAYRFIGGSNAFEVSPTYAGTVVPFAPPKQVVYYGGSKLWPAPQNWGWPPNAYWENAPNLATQLSPLRLQMAGQHNPTSLVQFTRAFALAPTGSLVTLKHQIENVSTASRSNAIWAINAAPRPSTLIAPVGQSSWMITNNLTVPVGSPWERTNDIFYTSVLAPTAKLFVITNKPWCAVLQSNLLWIMWGDPPPSMKFCTNEAPVEIWYGNDTSGRPFAEMELQGQEEILAPGAKANYTMYWRLEKTAGAALSDALATLRALGFVQ